MDRKDLNFKPKLRPLRKLILALFYKAYESELNELAKTGTELIPFYSNKTIFWSFFQELRKLSPYKI